MNAKIDARLWVKLFLCIVIGVCLICGALVVIVDPFFHYHKPDTERFYYGINSERNQNDGITKHFDYDAMITGTSMIGSFRTSQMDALFHTNSVKTVYPGGSYKEVNDNLAVAFKSNPNIKMILRGLDMNRIIPSDETLLAYLGVAPSYLYDDNVLNDVKYVLNLDVILVRVFAMLIATFSKGFVPGIDSFDTYGNLMHDVTLGMHSVCPEGVTVQPVADGKHLTADEKENVKENTRLYVTAVAKENPDASFYFFFTPYSALWWQTRVESGAVYKQIEAEKVMIEEILQCPNARLFAFSGLTDITTNLNHYLDKMHYASWVNSLMLEYMHDGKCELTYDNYEAYLARELEFYTTFDYASLNNQADYADDYYAETLMKQGILGVMPEGD